MNTGTGERSQSGEMDSNYVDVHAHLEMVKDPQRALREAYRAGVTKVIAVSINMDSFERTRKIRSGEVHVYHSIGIHPWEALSHLHELDRAIEEIKRADFVGEVGLDTYHCGVRQLEPQLKVFSAFLEACDGTSKVLNVHSVGAEKRVLKLLRKHDLRRVIMHWYDAIERISPLRLVPEFMELGCFMSVPLAVAGSKSLRELVKRVPLENLLTETDTHPNVRYGEVESSPRFVTRVVDEISEIKGVSRSEVGKTILANFERLTG